MSANSGADVTDLSGVIGRPSFKDWVYDGTRGLIHIVTGDGSLYSWNIAEKRYDLALHLGGTPGSVDISPDGSFLVVGNTERILTSGPFAFEKTYDNVVTYVNLGAQAVSRYAYAVTDTYHGGIGDIAVGADGKVLLTTFFNGSGWTPLRELDPATGAFRTISGVGRINSLPASSGSSSQLIMSEDRRYAFIQEVNISDGAMHVFDTVADTRLGGRSLYDIGTSGFQSGLGDISTAAGLVVDVLYSNVYVFDLSMQPVANLSVYSQNTTITGGEFNNGGHQLFLWQGVAKKVLVLDTLTWAPVGTLDVTTAVGTGYVGQGWGAMDVTDDGRMLILDIGTGLELIDLGKLKIEITGDATAQKLHGAVGGDRLLGGGGADTVLGYAGQDFLRGEDGNDSLSGGDAFDDMHGNQGEDTLYGGLGGDWVVGGQGNDVLFGEQDADVVYGNLGNDTVNGDDGADWVRGGQGDDSVSAGAGDDYVAGDRGADTLAGGAGADLFHTFAGAGIDRILDFNAGEGDRVNVLAGTTYTLRQEGADTIVDMGNGDQVVLVGVTLASLPAGWIFTG